ncbi:hypothetical protein PLICRDRAFT_110564 [Plicaturopsis crispa FD-325 SS-3]|nr:hypothetical protein PLICRDRAFT_110564 [Plicaturopsis crispa FD-325 SS-3]
MASEDSSSTTSYDDTCPLLRDADGTPTCLESQNAAKATYTPLPKRQMAALCSIRLVDPVAFTQIFPYVNEFMSALHVTDDPSEIGFYSGLVESAFAIAQLCSIYQWAQLSDVIGRRPVVLVGIVGISVASILFGLSKSLTGVLVARCLAGLFSGNVAVIHSVLGELTDETNQSVAYPIYGLFWPLGAIIGPLLGGTFSDPAQKFPSIFDYEFFRVYPYFLPCFMAAVIGVLSALSGYLFLDETLPSKRSTKSEKKKSPSLYGSVEDSNTTVVRSEPANFKSLLSIPAIFALSASGAALSFICTGFDVVFVLFCYSPVHAGGLGFSTSQIGYSLAISGTISATNQLFFMPYLLRTFNHARMYNFCMGLWPLAFLILPFINLVALGGFDETTGQIDSRASALVWIGIGIVMVLTRIAVLTYSISMILVKKHAPNPASLGASNGLVQFAMCLTRAFSPAFASSAFAFSREHNLLGGNLWVLIMMLISVVGMALSRNIAQHNK